MQRCLQVNSSPGRSKAIPAFDTESVQGGTHEALKGGAEARGISTASADSSSVRRELSLHIC